MEAEPSSTASSHSLRGQSELREESLLTRRNPWLSLRALVAIAFLGATAAVGYALGPVEQAEFTYGYRPLESGPVDGELPNPAVASLALARSVPDELRVTLPCEVADPASSFSSMRLEIWRSADGERRSAMLFPDLGDSLRITVGQGVVSAMVGSHEVLRAFADPVPGCIADIHYQDGIWLADIGGEQITAEFAGPRFAEAVFAGPAASSALSGVTVSTRELGTTPSPVQLLLLGIAVLSLGVVLREILVRGSANAAVTSQPKVTRGDRLRQIASAPDISVLAVLAAWTLFVPLNIDDGWIAARVGSYTDHGDIAGIFTANSAPMPFGYWLEWLQHLWLTVGDSPVLLRLPALLLGIATWLGLRSVGRSSGITKRGGAVWVMAGTFLVGFGAWGITLRAEPVIAALLVASLALAIRFDRGERGRVIVWWIIVLALAVSAHPAGIIVASPALVLWRSLWNWGRESGESGHLAVASLLVLGALVSVLFFFDSNVSTKLESIDAYQSDAHSLSILDEPVRYGFLNDTPYSTPMRRSSVALVFFGAGVALAGRRPRHRVMVISAWSVIVALALLSLTPSKWPWHFGGLLGLAALVLALGLRRLRPRQAIIAMLGLGVLMVWSWSESMNWAVFDLRTNRWAAGAVLLTVLAVGLGLTAFQIGRSRSEQRWSLPESFTVAAVGLVILLTGSTLVSDTIRTDGWTFGRQNVESLFGAAGCGLGDEVLVPDPGSLHVLTAGSEADSPEADAAAERAGFPGGGSFSPVGYPITGINRSNPVPGMGRYGSLVESTGITPEANTGSHRTGWHEVAPAETTVVLVVMGSYEESTSANAVGVQWGTATGDAVVDLGIEQASELDGYFLDWQMVAFDPPPGADRVRMLLSDGTVGAGDAWVASSDPLSLSFSEVSRVAAVEGDSAILVSPALAPYFPCVGVPAFEGAVVPVPGLIIQTWDTLWQTTYAAAAVSDRYFRVDVVLDPPLRSAKIGAHSGDANNFVFVSQEYLTGQSARVNGFFSLSPG